MAAGNEPGPVLRITVELREDRWRVVDRYHVPEMTIPPSEPLPEPGPDMHVAPVPSGQPVIDSWFEVLDEHGVLRYRQRMMAPPHSVEVFHDDGTITRIPAEQRTFSNDLLVPDLFGPGELRLYVEQPRSPTEAQLEHLAEPTAVLSIADQGR